MKITKPNITEGEWYLDKCETPNSLECLKGRCLGSICTTEEYEWELFAVFSDADQKHEANAKAISAVPDMIDELISDYEAFEWMYEHTNETAIADYCHDKMESIKQTLIKLGCTYEP